MRARGRALDVFECVQIDVAGQMLTVQQSCVDQTSERILDAGAVGLNLEDNAGSPADLAERIAAARTAAERRGVNLFINARTDIVLHRTHPPDHYVEESLARAKIYQDAGADGFFVPDIRSPEHIEAITKGTSLPVNVLAMPEVPDVAELRKRGVRRLSIGGRLAEVAYAAARRACAELLEAGTYSSFYPADITYAKMNKFFTK